MGARTDTALTLLVFAAVLVASVLANGSFSPSFFASGCVATLAFELVAARDPARVRCYWERRPVQAGAVALALVGVIVGARVAPSSVLSAMLGALVTYLVFLAVVLGYRHKRSSG